MPPLHVAVSVLAGVTGGPATYGRRLIAALSKLPEPLRISVLTDRPALFEGIAAEVLDVPMRGGLDRLRWQHLAVPKALRRLRPDVYHDTKNALPARLSLPSVVTVHDLAYHTVPRTFGTFSRLFLRRATADAARRASVLVVPSRATADDIARFYPAAAPKVAVVPHGIDKATLVTAEQLAAVRARLRLPARYVLHVGTVQARKNVDLLVQAVRLLRAQGLPHRVVLVGRQGWLARTALAEIRRDDTSLWLGPIDSRDLAAIYAGAEAFVSPSAYEGFGFSVGDALAAGVPTVISDCSALPEVCGDAAVRLSALSAAAIAAALGPLLRDPHERARLAAAGRARAATFTWQAAAEGHRAAYVRAASGRGN